MGGLEKAISTIANHLVQNNDVEVVAFTLYRFKHFYKLNENIKLIEPNFNKTGSNKFLYYFKIYFHFRKYFKKEKLDVILTFHEYCNFQVVFAALGTNIPVVISDRASPNLKITFPTNVLRNIFYPLANGVIAQTKIAAEKFNQNFGKKMEIKVIPNAIDLSFFNQNNILFNREKCIVWVGRFHEVKGLEYLFAAFERIAAKTDWNLVLIGDGPLFDFYIKRSKSMGLENRINFKGKTDNVFPHLLSSEIFALTSLSEGYPNALCEAMASGCACVSFDCVAGPSDIIDHNKNGFLVEYLSVEDLYDKLILLIENSDLRLNFQQEAIKIRQKLDLEIIGRQYLKFLQKIAKQD